MARRFSLSTSVLTSSSYTTLDQTPPHSAIPIPPTATPTSSCLAEKDHKQRIIINMNVTTFEE